MSGIRPMPGTVLLLHGISHTVTEYNPAQGYVELVNLDGELTRMAVEDLVHHRDLTTPDADSTVDNALLASIEQTQVELAHMRVAHCLEYKTGYRSGDPNHALPGEPKPCYDPASTTLMERLAAKAAELDNEFATRAGEKMGATTLRNTLKKFLTGGMEAVIDHRHVPRSNGHHTICPEVEEALWVVYDGLKTGTNITMTGLRTLTIAHMIRHHGKPAADLVPSRQTISRYYQERLLPSQLTGKARTRASNVTAPATGFINIHVTRPGELVAIDTNSLDVLLEGTRWENAVRGSLILAMDWYSRSIVSIRVVEQSESALDVAAAVRDIARPKQMLPGWPDEARWPYIGIPEQFVLPDSEHGLSGLPFVNPESIVPDHGNTYKAHHNMAAARRDGTSVLPARKYKPSDKAVVERQFLSVRTMFLQYLDGYRGSDTSERGRDVDNQVTWTAREFEDLLSLWAVRIWQTHHLDGVRPPGITEGKWSPAGIYQHGITTAGLAPRLLDSNEHRNSLPAVHCVIRNRGIQVRRLWYWADELAALQGMPSPRGGKHKHKWVVKYDARDLSTVYLLGPDNIYIPCSWTGAVPNMPPFTIKDVTELNRLRNARGIRPATDKELTEILLTEVLKVAYEPPTKKGSKKPKPKAVGSAEESRRARNAELHDRDHGTSASVPAGERGQDRPDDDPAVDVAYGTAVQHALAALRTQASQAAAVPSSNPASIPAAALGAPSSSGAASGRGAARLGAGRRSLLDLDDDLTHDPATANQENPHAS